MELVVERYTEQYVDRTFGYEPTPATRTTQKLVNIIRDGHGQVIHKMIIDTETVPEPVMISLGCYGDTGGWVSKFADLIRPAPIKPTESTSPRRITLRTRMRHLIGR